MGKLFLVGLGPGSPEQLSPQAYSAMEASEVLCGYHVYLDLMRPWFPDKEYYSTPMTREVERCRWALEQARLGKTVSLLCSGDTGLYGLAGPVLSLGAEMPEVEIEVIPGITAALSGAALLGAPLMSDTCIISLSDLLTPWSVIEKRLKCAAEGDFSICLYNPGSQKRRDHLRRACDILLSCRSPETVCGWVRNIGREGESRGFLSLSELRDYSADMFTTIFVGSSSTWRIGEWMVTDRGYRGLP